MEKANRFFGIISEFNPLHFGHKYIIDKCRSLGATHIICVMSGNFVQRGEPAIFSKWSRAKAAILSGADIVIEIPTAHAVAGAEKFASGAVSILDVMACVDTLAFGAETADVSFLSEVAKYLISSDFSYNIKKEIKKGIPFYAARTNVVSNILGENFANIIKSPNNILAVEYIKKLYALNSNISPLAVERINSAHDSKRADGFSASAIRSSIINGSFSESMLPEKALNVFLEELSKNTAPASIKKLEIAILAYLRSISAKELSNLDDISEGLENKIISCAKKARSLEEIYMLIKSKRYSHARIRRLILSAFLQIENIPEKPLYIKVLAANQKGLEVIRSVKEGTCLPIISKHSETKSLSEKAKLLYNEECRFSDIYSLCSPQILKGGQEQLNSIYIFD